MSMPGNEAPGKIYIGELGSHAGEKAVYNGWEGQIALDRAGRPVFSYLGGAIPFREGQPISLYVDGKRVEHSLKDDGFDSVFEELGKDDRFGQTLELPTEEDEALIGEFDVPEGGSPAPGARKGGYDIDISEVKREIRKGSERMRAALRKRVEENGEETA